MGAKNLKEYPSITKKHWSNNQSVTYEQHELVRLDARGGSPYPDGEWEWNGSYDVSVDIGDIDNVYRYEGSMWGLVKYYFDKRKGRRVRRYKYDMYLKVVGGDRLYLEIGRAKNLSKIDCKRLIVHMIHEFEKTDRFKEELWPRALHPDNREPIIKEIDGQMIWIATTWKGLWSALSQQENKHQSYGGSCLGYGTFYSRRTNPKMDYPYKKEDGWTDYSRGIKHYEQPTYHQVDCFGGCMSGGGLDMKKRGIYEARIDEAIWDTNDMLLEYITQDVYRNMKIPRW